MPVYFILARFSPEAIIEDDRRDRHIRYVRSKIENLRYGGVLTSDEREYEGICYYLVAEDRQGAESFIQGDPYFELYGRVTIEKFLQRIPLL